MAPPSFDASNTAVSVRYTPIALFKANQFQLHRPQFIDVTGAAGSTFGNGHSYFRNSPWVSSDILTLLAFNLDPARRGLEKDANQLVWKFPSDYIDRLQKTLLELHPELATNLTRDTL